MLFICSPCAFGQEAQKPPQGPNAVAELIKKLKSEKSNDRELAARDLGEIGQLGLPAVPALVEAFLIEDIDSMFPSQIPETLKKMGETAFEVGNPILARAYRESRDPRLRARAIRGIGVFAKHAKTSIPILTEAFKDENEGVRWEALRSLEKIFDYLDVVDAQVKAAVPNLLALAQKDKNPEIRASASFLVGVILPNQDGKDIPTLPAEKNISITKELVCPRLCALVDSTRNEAFGKDQRDDFFLPSLRHSAEAAYSTLDALFVVKGGAICHNQENSKFTEKILNEFLNESPKTKDSQKNRDNEEFSSLKIYKNQFDLLILKELITRSLELKLNHGQLESLAKKISESGLELSKYFGRFQDSKEYNSAMTTYAQACSGIAGCGDSKLSELPEFKKATQELIDLANENPTELPYDLAVGTSKHNKKGSAARAVPVNLLVYLKKKMDKKSKENLISALKNYEEHKEILVRHTLFYLGKHNENMDGIAPYYFYSTIPYAMAALRLLKSDSTVSDKEKEKVDAIESKLKTLLVRLIDDSKKAMQPLENLNTEKKNLYIASPRYSNALGGLALLAAYGDECAKFFKLPAATKEAPRLGILSGMDIVGIEAYLIKVPEPTIRQSVKSEKHTSKNIFPR